MIKKKEIDLTNILHKSLNKAFMQHGLLKEETVPTIPIKTASLGKEKIAGVANEDYKKMATILQPVLSAAGISSPKIKDLKTIISKLNEIIGMSEEEFRDTGTGMMSDKQKVTTNNVSEILSASYLYRTLYNILKEQVPHVAGRALEPFMSVLFLGGDMPIGDPIQDFYTKEGQYVSLKVVGDAEHITGSKINLAIGLSETDNKDKKIYYVVCVKDITSSPSKINIYSFEVDRLHFLNLMCISEKETGKRESFFGQNVEITSAGKKVIADFFNIKLDNSQAINDKIDELYGKPRKESLIREALTDNLPVKTFENKLVFVALFKDPLNLLPPDLKKIFFNNKELVLAVVEDKVSPQIREKAIEALQIYREKIKESFQQSQIVISDSDFQKVINYILEIAGTQSKEKTRSELVSALEGKKITQKSFYDYITSKNGTLFPKGQNILKIFNATSFNKNLEDIINFIDIGLPTVTKIDDRLTVLNYFSNPNKESSLDGEFRRKVFELSKDISNPSLKPYFDLVKQQNPLKAYYENDVYKKIEKIAEKNEVGMSITLKEESALIQLLKIIDDQFNERIREVYEPEFKEFRSKMLVPFKQFFDLRNVAEKEFQETFATAKPETVNADQESVKSREVFIEKFFANPDIFKKSDRTGQFKFRLSQLAETYGIPVNKEGTIFLNEKYLFQNSKLNQKKFSDYIEPMYKNITRVKEKSDEYFLKKEQESINAMEEAILALKLLETHINTKLKTDTGQIKKSEELTENLNLTDEAAIVMEMLQKLED